MGLVPSLSHPTSGTADPSVLTANDDAIRTVVNGQIDADNLAANAVTTAKIAELPQALVRLAVAQSIPNNTQTAVLFDTDDYDNDSIHSTASNQGRITATTAGLYQINVVAKFASNATGLRYLNGSTSSGMTGVMPAAVATPVSGEETTLTLAFAVRFTAGGYVTLAVQQTSGAALNLTSCVASAIWMGP